MPFIAAVSVGEAHDCSQMIGWISNIQMFAFRLKAEATSRSHVWLPPSGGSSGAFPIDDLRALALEDVRPLLDRGEAGPGFRRIAQPQRDTRHLEQRANLIVRQPH